MFADNPDFYPVLRSVARDMMKEISSDAHYFLEPNGGMGHLADVIKKPYTWEEAEAELKREAEEDGVKFDPEEKHYRLRSMARDDGYSKSVEVDVIESEPNFCAVLAAKNYPVVGHDWLSYNGVCYYDAIVMNPPFSNGDEHLLKAWDFLYKGEIVCLLNAETIRNPYTANRQKLVKIIEDHGKYTEIGKAFSTAERQTDVEVVRVYLKKDAPDDSFELWASEAQRGEENAPGVEADKEPDFLAIKDNLGNLVRWYELANQHFIRGFEEIRKGQLYLNQNKISDSESSDRKGYGDIVKMALSSSHGARADFLRKHRRNAWEMVFRQFQFHKFLDSKQQERMMRDVSRDMHLPFTEENIKATAENIFLSRKKLFDESVANVFDELCSHSFENGSGPALPASLKHHWRAAEGWKTNDSYKVNEKLIFPRGVEYSYSGFTTGYNPDAHRIYTDLDRILCVLDGQPFEECHTVQMALDRRCRQVGMQTCSGGWKTESEYFHIRFFKKGTVHLTWKREDLLNRFNQTAAAGKKWLGAETSYKKAAWRDRPDYYCEHHGHNYVDGVCQRCERPQVDPLDLIECPFCRESAEWTGYAVCPLHDPARPSVEGAPASEPEAIQPPAAPAVKLLAAPETTSEPTPAAELIIEVTAEPEPIEIEPEQPSAPELEPEPLQEQPAPEITPDPEPEPEPEPVPAAVIYAKGTQQGLFAW